MKISRLEIISAIILIVITLGVFVHIFAFANREVIFLYNHLGFMPFDRITVGRYWMLGFIVSGFWAMFYFVLKLTLFLINNSRAENLHYWNIIKIASIPLIFGIAIITMTLGEPILPFSIAISIPAVLIIGLLIGFSTIDDLFKKFKYTISYLFTGLGLVPFLTLFRAIELPAKGIISIETAIWVLIISFFAGVLWLLVFLRIFRGIRIYFLETVKGTLLFLYLGLPLIHFIWATPKGVPYITAADNFMAENYALRVVAWILLVLIVYGGHMLMKHRH
jgi:hypothetical protein